MNTNKLTHKNVVLPTLPDHSESRKFQNIAVLTCLGLALVCAISVVLIVL